MVTDPTRTCELLVGLPEVTVLGLDDEVGAPLSIHVETRARRPGCSECGVLARVKDRPVVTLVDLAAFGRPTRLVWHKFRWHCAEPTCPGGSWTEDEPSIAAKRLMLSDRAGRWVAEQVGRHARTVVEVRANAFYVVDAKTGVIVGGPYRQRESAQAHADAWQRTWAT